VLLLRPYQPWAESNISRLYLSPSRLCFQHRRRKTDTGYDSNYSLRQPTMNFVPRTCCAPLCASVAGSCRSFPLSRFTTLPPGPTL
jgi:hypothetical protein